ncbi:MAG: helix-turn-helix transcriptional regulator [Acidobacteriaceae bacterium]
MATEKNKIEVFVGSKNVFADLNLPNAEEKLAKIKLFVAINKIIEARKLTQKEAASLLGVNQPKVSALQNYKLDGFSVERLMHFAAALEYDVVIELRPRATSSPVAGAIVVVKAA